MTIAITGIGIISALGIGVEENRERLLSGDSAVLPAQTLPTIHKEWPIGEVGLSNRQLALLARQNPDEELSRNVLLGMLALDEALADSHLTTDQLKSVPLINGTTVGGMDVTERHYAQWRQGDYAQIESIWQHEADMTSAMLAQCFSLADYTTVSTACSSALNALIHGAGILRIGAAKRVVVGGTEAMTLFHLNGFASLGILSERVCRPFADDRDGINLGEGAAYLVLEDADCARERGAKIYGYIAGYGNCCDAYHQTASSPEGDGAYDAMRAALQMAGVRPEQVPYINAHGTATPNNDASELCAIHRLFGDRCLPFDAQSTPYIESTKPLTGHTTSASGSIELIFALMRMQEHGYDFVLSNAFGFGGNDSSVLISREAVCLPEDTVVTQLKMTRDMVSDGSLDYKPYIPAMQARRLTPMLRQLVVVAHKALEMASIEVPDAIIVGTQWGGMQPTMQLLEQLTTQGETDLSPAQFMSSTHNCAAGMLARLLHCKGYNSTLVSSADTLAAAKSDAALLIMTGLARNVLVCAFDETDAQWQTLLEQIDHPAHDIAKACIVCGD